MSGDTDKNDQMRSEQPNPLGSPIAPGDRISVGVGDAAKNVAAGKNIVQIGSLSIPRWAVLSIVAVLVLVAVLVGAVAYFSQQTGASTQQTAAVLSYTPTPSPTSSPVPTVTPTALPFTPAADGETMIVILPFHSTAATDSEVHKKIWRRIQELLKQKMPNESVTVVIDPNTVLTADQQAEAKIVGKRYNASMVIWGEDTGVELIASFLNIREPDFAAAHVDIDETKRTQLANPSQYAELVTRELPGQLAFLALFAVGQTYYTSNDYLAAIDTIESAVAEVSSLSDPVTGEQAADMSEGMAEAYYRLGWLYLETHSDLDAAISNYTKAITLDPVNAYAYNNRALAYSDKGEYAQALADYNKALALNPQDADVYNNRGYTQYVRGDLPAAVADYDRAIRLDPNMALAYINRGNALYDQGDLERANADYDRVIVLDPYNPFAYIDRGLTYSAKGEFDQAIADYNQAITLNPQNADAYGSRGDAYSTMGEFDRAIADYNQAITLKPEYATTYVNRGLAYSAKGELDRAIADYNQAITLSPGFIHAYVNRGIAYAAKGELDQAINDYNQVITNVPDFVPAYINRGLAYTAKAEYDQAITDYSQAITLDPQNAFVYNSRGSAYYYKGEYNQAIADYTQAITLDPKSALAYNNRANAYRNKGDLNSAITDYAQTVALDAKFAEAYNSLCWSLGLQQKPKQAIAYCDKAVSLVQDTNYRDSRGLAYSLLGEYATAAKDFQVYVDWLAENHPEETQWIEQRRSWIESLKRGENPFTPKVLEELKKH